MQWPPRASTERPNLMALLGSLGLAVALTWPMVLHPGQRALGSASGDGMKHLWTLWWMRASVWSEGVLPFQTTLINFPAGMELYPIEPLNGLVAVALPFVPIVVLSNLLVLANLTATGVAGAWFGRVLTGGSQGAGLVCGGLLMGSSVAAFFVHVGVGELLHLWWLPLGLGVLLRARETLRWPWFLGLAGCLAGATLSCFYLGFFLALAVATWALSTLWAGRKTPKLLALYALAAGLGCAVVVPATRAFSGSYAGGDVPDVGLWTYVLTDYGQPVTDPPAARLELAQVLTPGRSAQTREQGAYGGGRYLGVVALVLALVAVVRDPRRALPWVAVGGAGLLLALGTFLTQGGEVVMLNGVSRVRMPMLWLNRALGYVAEPLNFPVRFMSVCAMAVAALAALACAPGRSRWTRFLPILGVLALADVGAGQQLDWPWAAFEVRQTGDLSKARDLPHGAVLDLALAARSDHENRFSSLGVQIALGKPSHAVPLERIEYFARDGLYFVQALDLVKDLGPLYNGQTGGGPLPGDYRGDLAVLRAAGFRYMSVSFRYGHEALPPVLLAAIGGVLGEPLATGPGVGLWGLPEVAHTPAELAEWQAEHARAVEQTRRMTPGMGPPR